MEALDDVGLLDYYSSEWGQYRGYNLAVISVIRNIGLLNMTQGGCQIYHLMEITMGEILTCAYRLPWIDLWYSLRAMITGSSELFGVISVIYVM